MRPALVLGVLAAAGWLGAAGAPQNPEAALRLFADAERLGQDSDLEGSLRNYELLVQQFPQSLLADDALLRIASGRWEAGNVRGAREAIETLQREYPRSPGAAGAFVLDGDIRVDTAAGPADLQDARELFRNVAALYGRADFPALQWRARALLRAGQVSVLLGEADAAAALFLNVIEDEPFSPWTPRAQLELATTLLRSGDWGSGAEILQRIVDRDIERLAEGSVLDPSVAVARRRLQLSHRLLLRLPMSQPAWGGTRRLGWSGPPLESPVGVAASESGRLIVVDEGNPFAAVVEPNGEPSGRMRRRGTHPWWSGTGSVAYVAAEEAVLAPVSGETLEFRVVGEDGEARPLDRISGGASGVFGQWALIERRGKSLLLFDRSKRLRSVLLQADGREPVDVARDYRGRLYVLDRKTAAVYRFSSEGAEPVRVVEKKWKRPEAIATDELGNFYVLDRDAKTIDVFDEEGGLLWQLGPVLPGGVEMKGPRDLAVDGRGRIYVADKDLRTILVID